MRGKSRRGRNGRRRNVVSNKEKEDRISELPDAIILHILSYLDAQDAVRSGVLSKRFYNLWTDVPCLHFNQVNLECVYSTLLLHKLSSLQKISVIECHIHNGHLDRDFEFERLIQLLSSSNVRDLSLEVEDWHYTLPQWLYSISTIKKFRLVACPIDTKGLVTWKSLQSLCLTFVDMHDSPINDILSGCPSLELLKFSRCLGFALIDLTNHKCLKKLVIDRYKSYVTTHETIEIVAPNLQSLVLLGKMYWYECIVLDGKSLIDCHLDFDIVNLDDEDGERMLTSLTSLLEGLSHVEVVTIGDWILGVLSEIELRGLPCPMSKSVKCLKLERLKSVRIPGIVCLLRGLNCLEKLFINIHQLRFTMKVGLCDQDFDDWMSENLETGFDLNLKTVKIFGVAGSRDLHNDQTGVLLLVKLLLKNAKVVEDVTIGAYKNNLQKLTEELQSFPRSSPRAAIKTIQLGWG